MEISDLDEKREAVFDDENEKIFAASDISILDIV
jgi:hypothetical protein